MYKCDRLMTHAMVYGIEPCKRQLRTLPLGVKYTNGRFKSVTLYHITIVSFIIYIVAMKITTKRTTYSEADAFMDTRKPMFDRQNNRFFWTKSVDFIRINSKDTIANVGVIANNRLWPCYYVKANDWEGWTYAKCIHEWDDVEKFLESWEVAWEVISCRNKSRKIWQKSVVCV